MRMNLFRFITAIALVLVIAGAGAPATPSVTGAPIETPAAQTIPGETETPLVAVPGSTPRTPGQSKLKLSQTPERIAWQTDGGEPRSLSIQEFEASYPEIFDPGLSRFGRADVSPSGQVIAFIVSPVVGSLTLNGWHLGLADMDGALVGLYSLQTEPRCYVHDFLWLPDQSGIVVEPAACGAIGHLVLLTEDGKLVFDVTTRRIKGVLSVSPDSRWAALEGPEDRLNPRVDRRIEFISLEDPSIRLDLPAAGITEWLDREWVKRPPRLTNG